MAVKQGANLPQMDLKEVIFYKDFQNIFSQAILRLRKSFHLVEATEMSFTVSLIALSPYYTLHAKEELKVVREELMKKLGADENPDFDDWVVGLEVSKDNYLELYYFHGVSFLWTILEVFVRDIVVLLTKFDENTFTTEEFKKIKIPLIEYHRLSKEQQLELIVDSVVGSTNCMRLYGTDRFDCILSHVGLEGETSKRMQKKIAELQQVRNCFIHKNGVVDKKFLDNCPWLKYKLDDKLKLSLNDFLKFHRITMHYIFEISKRFHGRYPHSNHLYL
ncbi:MAG: hypothetical protein KIS88_04075 [Anaerolineales bacterium]|nr:hypothetical protein [Anaerolineales bacterium]